MQQKKWICLNSELIFTSTIFLIGHQLVVSGIAQPASRCKALTILNMNSILVYHKKVDLCPYFIYACKKLSLVATKNVFIVWKMRRTIPCLLPIYMKKTTSFWWQISLKNIQIFTISIVLLFINSFTMFPGNWLQSETVSFAWELPLITKS